MNIIKLAVKRRVTVMMLFVCIVMLGLVSFSRLGMDLMPDMEIPVAMVMTTYSGAGSEEVETMITETIETAVASVEGVQDIYSMSSTGSSMVMVQYDWGTDLDIAGLNLRERVAMVEGYLPDGADAPRPDAETIAQIDTPATSASPTAPMAINFHWRGVR